jgi:hypothetical protein
LSVSPFSRRDLIDQFTDRVDTITLDVTLLELPFRKDTRNASCAP